MLVVAGQVEVLAILFVLASLAVASLLTPRGDDGG